MRKTKTVQLPPATEERFDALVCDICGKSTKLEDNWAKDPAQQLRQVRIQLVEGEYTYTGDHSRTTGYDVCPTCWRKKIVPFMRGQGAWPRVIDSQW